MKSTKGRMFILSVFLLVFILCTFSCQDTAFINLKKGVDEVAQKMDNEFSTYANAVTEVKKDIEKLYNETDLDKVDISKMDEKNGGEFYIYKKGNAEVYTRRFVAGKDASFASTLGNVPLTDKSKKELYNCLQLEAIFKAKLAKDPYFVEAAFIGYAQTGDHDVILSYPNKDFWAAAPIPLPFKDNTGYIFMSTEAKDAAKFRVPIVSIASIYGITHWAGTSVLKGSEQVGVFTSGIKVFNLAEDVLKDKKENIMVVYKDTNIYGITKSLQDITQLKRLKDMDNLVVQKMDNTSISKDLALISDKQKPDIRKLGELVKQENVGKEDITIDIDGKKYKFYLAYVPAGQYYVLGLK